MKKTDLSNVQEATDSGNRLPAGGYICRITAVEDVPDKEYLKVEFDIRDGDYAGYYLGLSQARGFWAGRYIKSYKEPALPFFKRFVTSVEASNPGFVFDGEHEQTFIGKTVGLAIGYEEYIKQNGELGTRIYVDGEHSIGSLRDAIQNGKFKVPEFKKLGSGGNGGNKGSKPNNSFPPDFFIDQELNDDDLPF